MAALVTPWQDLVNGAFEALASVAVLLHCRAVRRARLASGVSYVGTGFFATWGLWNCYYYPHLGQWASFSGGVLVTLANGLWLVLIVKYRAPRPEWRYVPRGQR